MATTKIWPVHDSLKRLVDYACNPEKTEYKDLKNELNYVSDEEKTEQFLFVNGINCDADKAYDQMVFTKKFFSKMGGNVAYHGYQSFLPGEVDPEKCHQLGIKLAQELWGEKYQVLVTTHLDKEHLHNHFLINSVSFIDGKKFNDNKAAYFRMRDTSDRLCRENGLSVIEKPKGQTPRSTYFAEKNGEPTKFNLMREAIDTALEYSEVPQQFVKVLRTLGYEFNADPRRKYPTIKAIGSNKAVRIYRLGEEYGIEAINRRLEENRHRCWGSAYPEYKQILREKSFTGQVFRVRVKCLPKRKIDGLKGLYYKYCYLLGYLPKGNKRTPISPELKEAWRRIDRISEQVRLIGKYGFSDLDSVREFASQTEEKMNAITSERQKIYNKLRRCNDSELVTELKNERDICTSQLADLRKELKTAKRILEDTPKIKEDISKELQVRQQQKDLVIKDQRKRGYER